MGIELETVLVLIEQLNYVKLIIDGKTYYDDTYTWYDLPQAETFAKENGWCPTLCRLDKIDKSRTLKSMSVEVVDQHHTIITIESDEQEQEESRSDYFAKNFPNYK